MVNLNGWWAYLSVLGPPAMFLVTIVDTAVLPTAQAVDLLILIQAAAVPERSIELGLYAVAGSTIGAMMLYYLARKGGSRAFVKTFSAERIEQVRHKLARYDALALAVPTALPVPLFPMKLFVVSAGALEVDPARIAVTVAAARSVRYFGLILLGRWLGVDAWPLIKQNAWIAVAATAVIIAVVVFFNRGRPPGAGTDRGATVGPQEQGTTVELDRSRGNSAGQSVSK
ncbi:MAG: VTT domain-containing protein [Acidobacteria bacterium]|nr:VTT domain-containing protein [Acidobacteriota bacterium]MDA1234743.1 VTT domain-containing protein [Acidobacteriota bacterium]